MKPISTYLARAGCAAIVLLAGAWGNASAQTASNTSINNTATLSYSVNGVGQSSICSSPGGNTVAGACTAANNTTFQVDTKVNLNVVTKDSVAISTAPNGVGTMTFTVTNTGNAPQDFNLAAVNVASGQTVLSATDTFDTGACTFSISTAPTVGITKLSNIAAGSSVDVLVACTITALKGGTTPYSTNTASPDAAVVGLRATATPVGSVTPMAESVRAGATPGVVLADAAGTDDANTATPSRDASFSARSALKAVPAALTVTKAVSTLCDPYNGTTTPKAIPGAIVRYTITIANATGAPASAFLTATSDALDSTTLTGDADFVDGATAAKCALVGAGGVSTSGTNGNGIQVKWSGTATRTSFGSTTGTKYLSGALTSAALNVTSANWTTLLPASDGGSPAYQANELKPGEQIQLIFNAQIK